MTYNDIEEWVTGVEQPNKDNFIDMAYEYMEKELQEKGLYQLFLNNTKRFEKKRDKIAIGFNYLDHFGK